MALRHDSLLWRAVHPKLFFRIAADYDRQQNLPAALPAVPWLLGCSALRAEDALRPAKRELGFAGLGQALRAHLVTQRGFTDSN